MILGMEKKSGNFPDWQFLAGWAHLFPPLDHRHGEGSDGWFISVSPVSKDVSPMYLAEWK